jgi:hypothetical protein
MNLPRRTLLLAGLAGCTAPESLPGSVAIIPGVTLHLPGPNELGRSVEAAQIVRANYRGRDIVFEAQLSITPQRLLLACIDPLGRPAMTVRWEQGQVSAQRAEWSPASLRPENMLADIMLMYWPQPSLRQALAASNATVTDTPNRRTVLHRQQPIIQIGYQSNDPWNGTVSYESVFWNYTLDVQSVEVTS